MARLPPPDRLDAKAASAYTAHLALLREERRRLLAAAAEQRARAQAHAEAELVAARRATQLRSAILAAAWARGKYVEFHAIPTGYLHELKAQGFAIDVADLKQGCASGVLSWGTAYSVREERLAEFSASSMAWLSSSPGQRLMKKLSKAFEAAAADGKAGARMRFSKAAGNIYSFAGKTCLAPELLAEIFMMAGYKVALQSDRAEGLELTVRWSRSNRLGVSAGASQPPGNTHR